MPERILQKIRQRDEYRYIPPTKEDLKVLGEANLQGRTECSPEFLKEFDETRQLFLYIVSSTAARWSNALVRLIPKNFRRRDSEFLKIVTKTYRNSTKTFSPRGLFVPSFSKGKNSLIIVRRQKSQIHTLWVLAHEFGHFADMSSSDISSGILNFSVPGGTGPEEEAKADVIGSELVMRSDLSKERKEKILRAAWQIRKEINSRKEKRNDIV